MPVGKSIIDIAKDVIQTEADSVLKLKGRIDQNFDEVCQILKNCMGKVILIGMGKSGHIAKKSLPPWHQQGHLLSIYIQLRLVMATLG